MTLNSGNGQVDQYQKEYNSIDLSSFQVSVIFFFFGFGCNQYKQQLFPFSINLTQKQSQDVQLELPHYCIKFLPVQTKKKGGWHSLLAVFGLAVHSVAGSILLWGNFPVEGIFPSELTWVQTPFPKKLFRMRV